MASFDPKAVPAYESLRSEVKRQYDYMTKELGIKVVVTKEDPYANVDEMMRDINENKTLKVLSTASTGGHPFFTDEENDMFRAVHDFFGHGATGRDFSRHGERASYLSHASMMENKDSIRALFTETEMQNAALIANRGQFQEQKIGLAPDALVFDGLVEGVQASAAVFACYSKACAPPPVGRGGSTKVSRSLLRSISRRLDQPNAGFTLTPRLKPIKEGFAVAIGGTERYLKAKDAYQADGSINPQLKQFIVDRLRQAMKTQPPYGARIAVGGWHNPDDGVLEVNITVVFPPNQRSRAAAFARKGNQISMAHLKPGGEVDFIDTGGTGGDRAVTAAASKPLKNPKGGLADSLDWFPMSILTTSEAIFACYSKACAPPPVGDGGSDNGDLPLPVATAVRQGWVGLPQRDAARYVKAGLLVRISGKGKGMGNTPIWGPTDLARRSSHQTVDTRKVRFAGREHDVVGETETHFKLMKPNGDVFQIPKSIAKVSD